MSGRYRIAPNVVCRQTSSGLRMLFNHESGVMYELNDTASDIVSIIIELQPVALDAIAERLVQIFDVSPDEAREATEELLDDFVAAAVVTES